MDRETARQEIRGRLSCRNYLTGSKGGMYCCPVCGSGTGPHGTGAVKVYDDTNTWYCHACHKGGDVISLFRHRTGTDYNTALSLLAQELGVAIDRISPQKAAESRRNSVHAPGNIDTPPEAKAPEIAKERASADYMGYYAECAKRLAGAPEALEYLRKRGISPETAEAYWIGFDPKADPANAPGAEADAPKPHPCPRLILPTTESHYIARRIDGGKDFAKLNPAGSAPEIFNEAVLYAQDAREVFVTEGIFDALSVIEAGAPAISLNSAANADALIRNLEQRGTAATLILCLDNDEAGKKATEKLREGLQRLNISFITADISAGRKDPNEALTGDREAFVSAVEEARRRTAAKPDNTAYYIDSLMSGEIERFRDDKKTGFANLDAKAGGLYSGLYVLAAISSLGKTSFALQLADQLAERGNDVIYFSLEQSKLELVSKSLARRTAQKDMETAVTGLSIRKGYLPRQVLDAAREYKAAVADRISIVEGNFRCDIAFIGEYIRQYIRRTGTRPVVFIDYLQILQPAQDARRQSAKETVDNTVTEIKRISRELDLTLIVISSVNRANYLTPIDFESLKESGGIEYTADVIWGLQLRCLSEEGVFATEKNLKEKRERVRTAKAENPRKIELCCLKNRYGIANYSCYFAYYPANDLFTEQAEDHDTEATQGRIGASRI